MASTSDAWAAKMSVEDLVKGAKATADLAGLEFALDTSFLSREALLQAIQATAAPSPLLAVKNEPVKAEPIEMQQTQAKIKELEQQLAATKAAPPKQVPCQTPQNRIRSKGQASPAATSAQAAAPAPAAVAEDEDEEEPEEQDDQIGKVMVTSPDGTIVLTQDALRMRLKRMCEQKKKSHKCHVDNETHEQYASGGPQREWLEMALLEALQDVGTVALGRGKAAHKQASFKVRVTQIRERQMLKESETNGEWLTEEKMNKSGEYSKQTIKSIIAFCERFPQILTRKWKYDNSVTEYFVEISTKQTIKHSELLKRIENMDLGDAQLHWDGDSMNLGCSHLCY
ncbi:unnamed protein product [Symbiodinium sp. CCMP2592]|nr:unnamed protein product [Symbiodinium sp. CCMP2592]